MANDRIFNHTQGETVISQNTQIITALTSIRNAIAGDNYQLQSKTVTLQNTQQVILPDGDYYGLGQVTVPGVAMQTKTATPTTSQQIITPDAAYAGLSQVTVEAIPSQYHDTSQVDATAADVLTGKKIVDANGNVLTGTLVEKTLGTKTFTENGTYTASDDSVDGYSEVTIDVSGGGGGALTPAHFDLNTGYVNGAKWTILSNTNSRTDVYQITSAGRYIIMHGGPGGEKTYIATFDSDPALATDTLNGTQIANTDSAGDWRSIAVYPSVEIEADKWLAFTKNRSNTDGQQTIVIKIA